MKAIHSLLIFQLYWIFVYKIDVLVLALTASPYGEWHIPSSSLEFLVIGDEGLDIRLPPEKDWGVLNLTTLVKEMGKNDNTSFVLLMGDHFYEKGIRTTNSSRWNSTFEDVFSSPSLLNIPFFGVLGNHDYYGNANDDDDGVMAQINYTHSVDNTKKRWILPWFYYDFIVRVGNPGMNDSFTVQMIMMDSYSYMDYKEEGCHKDNSGKPKPYYCNGKNIPTKEKQLAWLENRLQTSTADWLFVGGHFPICSVGEHGVYSGVQSIPVEIRLLLQKYRVDAYFSGHDHLNQVFSSPMDNSELVMYSMGSSGKVNGQILANQTGIDQIMGDGVCKIQFITTATGYSRHRIHRDHMEVHVIDMFGNIMHKHVQKSRRLQRTFVESVY